MFNATDSVEAGSILKPSLIPDRQISVPVCQSVNTSYFLANAETDSEFIWVNCAPRK